MLNYFVTCGAGYPCGNLHARKEKIGQYGRERLRIVLMNHMAGIVYLNEAFISESIKAGLLIGAVSLVAILAFDNENRDVDAAEKFNRLKGIERLGRSRAVQRVEFPNPFASLILLHSSARQLQSQIVAQPGIRALQLPGACVHSAVFAKMVSPPLMQFRNPFLHSQWRVGKIHSYRADAFDQYEPAHATGKRAGVQKGNRAAHGVSDERETIHAKSSDDAIEIEDVVRKVIITAGADPTAVSVAAAIRRDYP